MIFTFIGLIVGMVMGLTGAGGALISIPLFMFLAGRDLKSATILSLMAVIFGTGVSLIGKVRKVSWEIVLGFTVVGAITNYLSLPLKALTPDLMIAFFLLGVGLFSIKSIWIKKTQSSTRVVHHKFLKIVFTGTLLGVTTTLTGLGGGVLLVPILLAFFGKTYDEALPTSLASILLISSTSLIIQSTRFGLPFNAQDLMSIGSGAIVSFFGLRLILKKIDEKKVDQLRKYTFTVLTLYSIMSVMIKTING